jgi:AraC-like DNA-binding protein
VHRSPIDYLNYYRIECASYFLVSSDMTVAEIAQHCGYNDSSFFIKQFRKYKGTTPRKYRMA